MPSLRNNSLISPAPNQVFEDMRPGTICRLEETNEIHCMFPFRNYLVCTEDDCDCTILSDNWSEAMFNLRRHIQNIHKVPLPEIIRWCSKCKVQIPQRITSHTCFSKGGYFRISKEVRESQSFKYKCLVCGISFPRQASLSSHSRYHDKIQFRAHNNVMSLKEKI